VPVCHAYPSARALFLISVFSIILSRASVDHSRERISIELFKVIQNAFGLSESREDRLCLYGNLLIDRKDSQCYKRS